MGIFYVVAECQQLVQRSECQHGRQSQQQQRVQWEQWRSSLIENNLHIIQDLVADLWL